MRQRERQRSRTKVERDVALEEEKKGMIYENLTCFVYVLTLYKIIERIIAIKIKTTSFTRKARSIQRYAPECVGV